MRKCTLSAKLARLIRSATDSLYNQDPPESMYRNDEQFVDDCSVEADLEWLIKQ